MNKLTCFTRINGYFILSFVLACANFFVNLPVIFFCKFARKFLCKFDRKFSVKVYSTGPWSRWVLWALGSDTAGDLFLKGVLVLSF